VWESSSVRVFNRRVLWESEIDCCAVICNVKRWKLNGADGDFGILWFEKCEVKCENCDEDED
jgi:hypothetical protein